MMRIFISHSHSDEMIAFKLVQFLMAALGLKEKEILCTSNPDQGLSYSSSSIIDQLKKQLKNSEALIVLITADSLYSTWIPFEAGSFWTTDKPIIPILGPSLTQNDLPGPLKSLLSIPIEVQDAEDRLNNATTQLAKSLNLQQEFSRRRSHALQEFSDSLRAWQSKRLVSNSSQQEKIEHLKAQISDLERSHSNQLKEIEATFQQEKKALKRTLYYICNLHRNDHILNYWEKIYIIDAKGGLKEKERISIAPIPDLDQLFFKMIKRGAYPNSVPRVVVKNIEAINTKNNNELEIVEISRDTKTIEYVIILDPPATAQNPVEFKIESYRPDIFKPLIDKLNDHGGFEIPASSLSNAKVKFIAPQSLEFTSFSIHPMVGNHQITDDVDGRSSLTWEAPSLHQGSYSYVIQAKKK